MKSIFLYTPQYLYLTLIGLLIVGIFNVSAQDIYTVSVDDVAGRTVTVRARLHPNTDTLLMSPFGATHLENGWATFVHGLEATDKEGRNIEAKRLPNGVFVIPGAGGGKQVNLTYQVRIQHDQGQWPFGYKEAAYVNAGMMMATGNALFITRLDVDSAAINFRLKEPNQVATSWRQTGPATFVAKGAEELVWTVLALGDFNLADIRTGDTQVLLAYNNTLAESKNLLEPVIQNAIKKYENIYGGPPAGQSISPSRYLYVINVDSSYEGGGASFTNSISILLNEKPGRTNKAVTTSWHHILIHEIGHLWNASSLKTDEQTEWFKEGFTDYLAYLVEYELGLFNKAEWDRVLSQKQAVYKKAREKNDTSLENAGYDKGRNYDIIYSGGLVFAHKLDNELKRATKNKKDISDFLKNMHSTFSPEGRIIRNEDIRKVAEQTCACDLKKLFSEVKSGT